MYRLRYYYIILIKFRLIYYTKKVLIIMVREYVRANWSVIVISKYQLFTKYIWKYFHIHYYKNTF